MEAWKQVDGAIIRAVRRKGAGALRREDAAYVMVDRRDGGQVNHRWRSLRPLQGGWQSRMEAAGVAAHTPPGQRTCGPVYLGVVVSQPW